MMQRSFERLCQAFEAAGRRNMWLTQSELGNRLLALGAYIDDNGDWRQDTRPHKPVPPTDGISHDAEVEL